MTTTRSLPAHSAMSRGAVEARPPLTWRVALAYAGLAAVALGCLWIAAGGASNDLIVDTAGAPEPGWLGGPLHDLGLGLSDTGFSVALVIAAAGYLALVAWGDLLSPRIALAALGLAALALTLAPPLLSSDLFGYIGYGRLGAVHGLNPYRYGVIAAPRDPVLPLIYWQHPTSPYGPLFTLVTYAMAHASLGAQVWTLKGLAVAGWAVSVALAWRVADLVGRPPLAAALVVAANPLLLVYGVGGGHNDLLVMALVFVALPALLTGRALRGGAGLAAAAAVKVTGAILLPFALVGGRGRGRIALGALVVGVPVAALTLAVFGLHVLDTLGHIVTGNSFNVDYTGPDLLGRALGTGITPAVRAVGGTLAGLVTLAMLVRAWRGGDWLTAAGWATLAVLCALPSFVPWYLAWVLPMAALTRSSRLRLAAVALTVVVVATHLPALGFPAYE